MATLTVLGTAQWVRQKTIEGQGGIEGQLTHCQAFGYRFYVRENTLRDHFHTSSNERWGWKQGLSVGRGVQVLELCAPKVAWERIAKLVAELDALKRPVRRNRLFTYSWAKRTMEKA